MYIYIFFFLGGGGGVQENQYFGGMKTLWIFFGGHHTIELYLGVISMHYSFFFTLGKGKEWGIFLGLLKFKYYLGCLKFLIFFFFLGGGGRGVKGRCWARASV